MKTLADFKRDAASGKMSLEILERYGKTGDQIPEKMRGSRKVMATNTVCVKLLNNDGVLSELRFTSARLMEYDGDTLIIYDAGLREPTEQEKEVLDNIKKIYHKYEDTYSGGFWQVKDYIKNSPCPWMQSNETVKGKRYMGNDKVMDNAIRGDVILRYMVHMEV